MLLGTFSAKFVLASHLSSIRSAVERRIAHLKNWKILAAGYRRPLRKLAICLAAAPALEFYRPNWTSSE